MPAAAPRPHGSRDGAGAWLHTGDSTPGCAREQLRREPAIAPLPASQGCERFPLSSRGCGTSHSSSVDGSEANTETLDIYGTVLRCHSGSASWES